MISMATRGMLFEKRPATVTVYVPAQSLVASISESRLAGDVNSFSRTVGHLIQTSIAGEVGPQSVTGTVSKGTAL